MAKRIGVLEPAQAESESPTWFVKKTEACRWVRCAEAVWIIKNQVVQKLKARMKSFFQPRPGFTDGPLGVGNAMPFSRRTDAGQHYHYEIPHAGDIGLWRHLRKRIRVSARSRHNIQILPAGIPVAALGLAGSI
jgi:hypothetical protein